jgi:hypothetical protein
VYLARGPDPDLLKMRTSLMLAAAIATLSATFAAAQDVGIPACDAILKTYDTCVIPKSPPAAQAQLKTAFDQMRTNWTAVAATAEGKKSLEPVCKQTADQMKQQLAPLGCAW